METKTRRIRITTKERSHLVLATKVAETKHLKIFLHVLTAKRVIIHKTNVGEGQMHIVIGVDN